MHRLWSIASAKHSYVFRKQFYIYTESLLLPPLINRSAFVTCAWLTWKTWIAPFKLHTFLLAIKKSCIHFNRFTTEINLHIIGVFMRCCLCDITSIYIVLMRHFTSSCLLWNYLRHKNKLTLLHVKLSGIPVCGYELNLILCLYTDDPKNSNISKKFVLAGLWCKFQLILSTYFQSYWSLSPLVVFFILPHFEIRVLILCLIFSRISYNVYL